MSPLPSFWAIFNRAWASTTQQLGILAGAWFVLFLILFMTSAGVGVATQVALASTRDPMLIQVVNNSVNGVLGIVFLLLYAGLLKIHLDVARGQVADIGTLFKQGRLLGYYVLTNSLAQVVVVLLYVPVVVIAGPPTIYLFSQKAFGPGLVVGLAFLVIALILVMPAVMAVFNAMFFVMDVEQDPVAALVSGFHSVRGQGWWAIQFGLWAMLGYLAALVFMLFTCGLGALLVSPLGMLIGCHAYLALAERMRAKYRSPLPQAKVPEPEPNPYAGDAPVYRRSDRFSPPDVGPAGPAGYASVVTPRTEELVVPAGCTFLPPRPVSERAIPIAIVLFVPWFISGGNPLMAGVAGWYLSRRVGFPEWIGITSGIGAIMLCGLAALVLLVLAYRGKRAAVVDMDGICLDATQFWEGVRVRWHEIEGFRIEGDGIHLRMRGRFRRWLWRPVLPTSDRQTHDVVELLEANRVYRLEG